MAIVKVPAQDWSIYVSDNGTSFTLVRGISELTMSEDMDTADVTSFDDLGKRVPLVTTRQLTVTTRGFLLLDPETGEQDAGQNIVEQIARKIGLEAYGYIKIVPPGSNPNDVTPISGVFRMGDVGGGVGDGTSWGFEFQSAG